MRTSINQNRIPLSLPELRNLGTILRILLLVNAVVMIAAFVREERGAASLPEVAEPAAAATRR